MEKYKSLFSEDEDVKLDDVELAEKLIQWFRDNPYPQDHSGLHEYAKSLGMDSDVLETYVYAFISCFLSGGNFVKSDRSKEDFDPEEIKMGHIVEVEHVDKDNDNPVVQKFVEIISDRITLDHLADNDKYYSQAKEGKLQIEELV